MKEWLRKGYSLLEFNIASELTPAHFSQQAATFSTGQASLIRWQFVSNYWLGKVPRHFLILTMLSYSAVLLIQPAETSKASAGILLCGILSFAILFFSFYLPLFVTQFLPRLLQMQAASKQEQSTELEKCRKAQLPNDTLVLIWYVLDKSAGLNSVDNSDDYTALLTQLYGIDRRSIKKGIDLFWGSASHRSKLKGRARTEIENRFSEARQFFETLRLKKANSILQDLEHRCFSKG